MPEEHIKLENPKGFAVTAIDGGTHTALVFKMRDAPIGVALNNQDLSRLACRVISEAEKHASRQAPSDPPKELRVDPISAVSIGVGRGRSDAEGLLTLRLGNLNLTFALELSTLTGMCEKLQAITTKVLRSKPN